jgi:hypothetical protein
MATPEQLIHLTDAQITTVMQLARPLAPHQRTAFLELLVSKLSGREIGDGTLYRLCRELQREYFSPPTFNIDSGASRSRRRIDDDSEDDRPHRKLQPRSLGAL